MTTPIVIRRPMRLLVFAGIYLWELTKANAVVAREILTPSHSITPGIIECRIELTSDLELALFANLVSFTPGTLVVEIAPRVAYVHALHMRSPDDVRRRVRRLEQQLRWVMA